MESVVETPNGGPETEVLAKAQRRRFSAEYKRRILKEADRCLRPGEIGALLRREGLDASALTAWRAARERGALAGLAPKRRGPWGRWVDPRDRTIAAQEREIAQWRTRAQRAEALVEIQKKFSEMVGLREFSKIKFPSVPEQLADIASEAANSLRSALDRTGYATAVASGKTNPKKAYFPIADSEAQLKDVIDRRCTDLPKNIVALFRTFKPYKGRNDLLWALNRIANTNKHCRLVPVDLFVGSPSMEVSWRSTEHEIVYTRNGVETNPDDNLCFQIDIAFDEVDVIRGQPICTVLGNMSHQVQNVLHATALVVNGDAVVAKKIVVENRGK